MEDIEGSSTEQEVESNEPAHEVISEKEPEVTKEPEKKEEENAGSDTSTESGNGGEDSTAQPKKPEAKLVAPASAVAAQQSAQPAFRPKSGPTFLRRLRKSPEGI